MRYHALATDYDGTLAWHGEVEASTVSALQRLKDSGRKLLLVTGRELPELQHVFPQLNLFDFVVAENGALLYRPSTMEEKPLAEAPSRKFADRLRERGVHPLSVGRVIVATVEPNEVAVLEAIREYGLELQVIFNKGAVMVLPPGVNKATGLKAALEELGLSIHNVVGVGDAENDHAFLQCCECSVTVANALPALKEHADWTTNEHHGRGVEELIEGLLRDDLQSLAPRLTRHELAIGTRGDGTAVSVPPFGNSVLIAGTSGGGKSTLVTSFFERLDEHGYQTCIIDPEGDYTELEEAMLLGDAERTASAEEVLKALEQPGANVVVNLVAMRLEDRPEFFQKLLPHLQELRARTGRPHWIIVDETHHLLPASLQSAALVVPAVTQSFLFVTVNPRMVSPTILAKVDTILAIGQTPELTIQEFCEGAGTPMPQLAPVRLEPGEVLAWQRAQPHPVWFRSIPPKGVRRRHIRKYAQGELAPDFSFYFEGPEQKLHLRAQNLEMFMQLAEGIDDETWQYHLEQGDYSQWFREQIKDEELAAAAEAIEKASLNPAESREAIRHEVERRYTAAA